MKLINTKLVLFASICLASSLYANQDLLDGDIEDILSMQSEIKADIGSRDGARNYLDSNTPIDIITSEQIEHSGLTSLTDILRYFIAGFNAPETSVADGSDHVRAYTLRGMNPDQILVLINGKRVHTSALLHVNGVIGRGSSHVDLDTIAVASIQRVEILRDGAAAQYGSDAISGVINIILKGMGHKSSVRMHSGERKDADGRRVQADAFITVPLKYDGFINLTLDATQQEQTQRAGTDNRLSPPSVETHVGIPESTSYKAMFYTEIPQDSDINIYAQALLNYKDSQASAFFRPSSADSTPIYSNGFLPIIRTENLDYSAVVGVKGEVSSSTTWELSNSYGVNDFHYFVEDSMNYSLGSTSPTSFDNGSLNFMQNTTTLDFKKSDDIFRVAGGIEYRYENYSITAGDASSFTGTGSQGFAGYALENEADENRYSYALYVDSIYDFSDAFMFEVALRYEEYSDFGESTNGKVALSYQLVDELMFRSSASTAFRAPALAQSFYSQTSSFVDSSTGNLSTQGTFRTDHEVSQALGAKDLISERSKHLTIGSVYQPTKETSFTVDYFYIDVNDKIILSPELTGQTQAQKDVLTKHGVSSARFFANAAATNTQGVDIKLNYKQLHSSNSQLDLGVWYNYSTIEVKKTSDLSITNQSQSIKTMIEDGQPKDSLKFLTNYIYKSINSTLNISRYGSYKQMIGNQDYTFDAAWIADADISYSITKDTKVAIGGHNIFDTTPNKWDNLSGPMYGTNGIKPYSRYSPFGYSGAYYYLRASMEF